MAVAAAFKREAYEQRTDNAHALISFIYGEFYQPSVSGLHIGLPLFQYKTPRINLATGRWTFHATETIDDIATAMKQCNISLIDTITQIKRDSKDTTALIKILERINDIDGKIHTNLTKNKTVIAENHALIIQTYLLARDLNIEEPDDITENKGAIIQAIEKETALDKNAINNSQLLIDLTLTTDSFNPSIHLNNILKYWNIPE